MKTSHGGALSVRTDFEKYYYPEGVLFLSKLNKKDCFLNSRFVNRMGDVKKNFLTAKKMKIVGMFWNKEYLISQLLLYFLEEKNRT